MDWDDLHSRPHYTMTQTPTEMLLSSHPLPGPLEFTRNHGGQSLAPSFLSLCGTPRAYIFLFCPRVFSSMFDSMQIQPEGGKLNPLGQPITSGGQESANSPSTSSNLRRILPSVPDGPSKVNLPFPTAVTQQSLC